MYRRLLAALAPLLVAACQLAPDGRCERDGDCLAGQHCSASICVSNLDTGDVGASCAADADCESWADCQRNTCVLSAGACLASADCPSWKECIDHACVLIPGRCVADAHCASWQTCNTKLACAPQPGRCGAETDCAAWQDCDASNTCVTAAGSCASSGDCVSPRECGADHVCAFPPGVCDVASDCHGSQTCEAHACVDPPLAALDPATVVLWGALEEGQIGLGALARLDAAAVPYAGFGGSSRGLRAFLTGAGDFLYTQHEADSGDRQRIRKFRQDSFAWDASASRWLYPAETAGNDPEVPTPACDAATTLTSWVVQRGTGEVLYACGGTTYFDSTGATRLEGYTLHAWQATGEMLVTTTDGATTTWLVLDASGTEVPLTDFALAPGDTVVAARTSISGFSLLVQRAGGTLSLWEVYALFPAVDLGDYPAMTGYTPSQLAVDEDGALHVLATDDASPGREVVLRLTLPYATPPSDTSVVYSEADAPTATWWTTDPPSFFVFAGGQGTSRLVTTP